jgi:hypothetical protein
MKKTTIALTIIAALSFSANSADILEISKINVHGTDVSLGTTLTDDGDVCMDFIKSSAKNKNELVIIVDKICGEKFEVSNGLGGSDIYPENLKSMRFDTESQSHIINEDS